MTLSLADESTHYIYSFDVHDHIVCIQQCLKETHDVIYYYALFKSTELLCTCKRDFDWRQIPSGSDVTVQRFEIREGINPLTCRLFRFLLRKQVKFFLSDSYVLHIGYKKLITPKGNIRSFSKCS